MKAWYGLMVGLMTVTSACADDAPGGMRSFLTVGGGVVWDDNPDFAETGASELRPLAELRFGLTSETRRQSLALRGGVDLRDGKVDQGIVSLGYTLASVQSQLSAGMQIERLSAGSFDGTLTAGTAAEGPDVVDLLPRGGKVTTTSARLEFETGLRQSIGFEAGLTRDRRAYSGAAPRDFDQGGVSGAVVLRFSKRTEARVSLAHTRTKSSGLVTQGWQSDAFGFELAHQLDLVTRVSMGFGFRRIDGVQAGAVLRRRGTELRFGLTRDLSDGEVFARASVVQQSLGRRVTLRFGMDKDAGHSGLSAWVGATDTDSAGTDLIGGIRFGAAFDQSQLAISLSRDVTQVPDSDDSRLADRIGVQWDQQLSPRGTLNLWVDYLRTDASQADAERKGARLQMVYRHAVQKDWDIKAGARWRIRQDTGGARTQSRSVFLTFEKRFEAMH